MLYQRYLKRPLDFVLALVALTVLSPLLLLLAMLVRIKLGSPVIFRQPRPGLCERIFVMYKFRTMTDDKDDCGQLLPDSMRMTKFGKMLRATSLDELPELFNILRGDMSLVGPRPQLVRDMVFMTPAQRLRHTLRPGLTGWAQVNGRNGLSWKDKLSLDLDYVSKISFISDLNIVVMTVVRVFRMDGITSDGMDTAEDLGDYLLRIGEISKEEYQQNQALSSALLVGDRLGEVKYARTPTSHV